MSVLCLDICSISWSWDQPIPGLCGEMYFFFIEMRINNVFGAKNRIFMDFCGNLEQAPRSEKNVGTCGSPLLQWYLEIKFF